MKKLVILSILTIAFTISANAQDKTSDLKKLFGLMNSETMMDGMMNSMMQVFTKQASEKIKGDDAKEKFDAYMGFVTHELKELTTTLVNEVMVDIYDKHFTHEEIKELLKFYESSIGKKMIEKTPEITSDLMTVMMTQQMPEFHKRMIKKMEELK